MSIAHNEIHHRPSHSPCALQGHENAIWKYFDKKYWQSNNTIVTLRTLSNTLYTYSNKNKAIKCVVGLHSLGLSAPPWRRLSERLSPTAPALSPARRCSRSSGRDPPAHWSRRVHCPAAHRPAGAPYKTWSVSSSLQLSTARQQQKRHSDCSKLVWFLSI